MEKSWYLSPIDAINILPENELTLFYQKSSRKTYPRGTLIFSPGDPGDLIYYTLSGRIKIHNISPCGKEVIYWFCLPREFFGLSEVCGGEKRTVFAEAVEESELLSISGKDFEEFLGRNPRIALVMIRILGSRIRQTHEIIRELITCDVHTRLAQLLIKLGQLCGSSREGSVVISTKFTHR